MAHARGGDLQCTPLADPYIHIIRRAGLLEVSGEVACSLGHQISRGGGEPPDGVFAEWNWDGATLQARNDRYGCYPLYYFATKDEICLSPSILDLLARGAPTELDDRALAVLLRLGFFIGEDTPFRHIRRLPTAAHFEWTQAGLSVSGSIALGKPSHLSRAAALDGFITLVRQAVRRRSPPNGDFVMPLSGGKDSRHILFELCAAGYRPRTCVTVKHYPPRPNEDAEIASQVTQALGLSHTVLDLPRNRLRVEVEKNLLVDMCAYDHGNFLIMARYLEGLCDTAYDGLGGDILTGAASLTEGRIRLFEAGRLPELAESYVQNEEKTLSLLLTSEAHRRFNKSLALERLISALDEHVEAPCPVNSFRFWTSSRRAITPVPYGLLRGIRNVFTPYLDHDVYDLLASLPARMLLPRTLHSDALHRAFPAYRHIPFEKKGGTYATDLGFSRRFAFDVLRWSAAQGPSRLVQHSWLLPRWVRSIFTRDPGRIDWYYPRLVIYLLQLEGLVRTRARGGR